MSTTPESIVTSLDWSKKLKEAGWPQKNSMMAWWICKPETDSFVGTRRESLPDSDPDAPTAEEILRRMPHHVEFMAQPSDKRRKEELQIRFLAVVPSESQWSVGYGYLDGPGLGVNLVPEWTCTDDTLANAAAAMYCYLAEQKLLPQNS